MCSRIATAAPRGDLGGHIHAERHDLKSWIGFDFAEYLSDRHLAAGGAFTKQNGDFQQGDGADGDGLAPPDRLAQNPRLLS